MKNKNEWIKKDKASYRCPECGAMYARCFGDWDYNFCPNCGTPLHDTENYADIGTYFLPLSRLLSDNHRHEKFCRYVPTGIRSETNASDSWKNGTPEGVLHELTIQLANGWFRNDESKTPYWNWINIIAKNGMVYLAFMKKPLYRANDPELLYCSDTEVRNRYALLLKDCLGNECQDILGGTAVIEKTIRALYDYKT